MKPDARESQKECEDSKEGTVVSQKSRMGRRGKKSEVAFYPYEPSSIQAKKEEKLTSEDAREPVLDSTDGVGAPVA